MLKHMLDLTHLRRTLVAVSALLTLWALPVAAAPALFSANLLQSGGIMQTDVPYLTAAGATDGVAYVETDGDIVFPARAALDVNSPGYTFDLLPIYPYIWKQKIVYNEPGTVAAGYFTAGVPVTVNGTNVNPPYVALTPRNGWMRFNPGAAGFGGKAVIHIDNNYIFDIITQAGILKAKCTGLTGFASIGAELGHQNRFTTDICQAYPDGYPSLAYTTGVIESGNPWATGMVTMYNGNGAAVTTTTQTGTDSRSAFDTGSISLVTPRTQWVYQGDGSRNGNASILSLRDAFSVIHTYDLTFLPEPSHLAMMLTGVVGLLGLGRLRR